MGEGNSFSLLVCPQGGGGYLPLPLAKVPTPQPGQDGWEEYPKVPTPQPRYLPPGQVRMGEGVPQGTYPPIQGTYPPARSGWGRVPQGTYPLWPRHLPPWPGRDGEGVPQGTNSPPPSRPRYLPPAKDLLHGGWYTSCVHAGGLSCLLNIFIFFLVKYVITFDHCVARFMSS